MLLFLFLFLLIPTRIFAVTNEFTITQNVNYEHQSNFSCSVEEKVEIINNFSQIYLKEYKVNLSLTNLQNIKAYDAGGSILQKIEQNDSSTSIFLKFNQPQVGKNQKTSFTLTYSLQKCSTKKGKTIEIVLPNFSQTDQNHLVNITLQVPTNFGNLSTSSIKNFSYHQISNHHLYKFPITSNSPTIFIFGDHQLFDFSLDYYLQNPENNSIQTQIALPPDTDYQTVTYTKIIPPPTNVKQDGDGNWLATYTLKPQEQITINASGQVKIKPPIHSPQAIDQSKYLVSQNHWPIDSPQVKTLPGKLDTPKSIYDFVVRYLSYDYTRFNSAKRQGALFALNNPQNALCTEFTDLFVTVARSRNIPAREIQGFAFSSDDKIKPINITSDVLHAWPQYYDSTKNIWVSVDPTWEKTTNGIDYFTDLDLNHFTFVIHGLESEYPSPPGAYKNSQQIKTVNVNFSPDELESDVISPIISNHKDDLRIKNPNLFALHNVSVSSKNQILFTINLLPPLGEANLNYSLPFYQLSQSFTVKSEETAEQQVTVDNQFKKLVPIFITSITIILLCILGIILARPKHEKIA